MYSWKGSMEAIDRCNPGVKLVRLLGEKGPSTVPWGMPETISAQAKCLPRQRPPVSVLKEPFCLGEGFCSIYHNDVI